MGSFVCDARAGVAPHEESSSADPGRRFADVRDGAGCEPDPGLPAGARQPTGRALGAQPAARIAGAGGHGDIRQPRAREGDRRDPHAGRHRAAQAPRAGRGGARGGSNRRRARASFSGARRDRLRPLRADDRRADARVPRLGDGLGAGAAGRGRARDPASRVGRLRPRGVREALPEVRRGGEAGPADPSRARRVRQAVRVSEQAQRQPDPRAEHPVDLPADAGLRHPATDMGVYRGHGQVQAAGRRLGRCCPRGPRVRV